MPETPLTPHAPPPAHAPVPGPPRALDPWPPQDRAARRRGRGRTRDLLIGALAGGLVGALAAGGILLAVDEDGATTRVVSGAVPVVSRPSSTVEGGTDIASIIEKAEPALSLIHI